MPITLYTPEMLTGQTHTHLIDIGNGHLLHPQAAKAFKQLKLAAQQANFNLQPASTFRDFNRQLTIWNEKFSGIRPLLDNNNHLLNSLSLDEEQRCLAILHWSALPGTSRHHWGTDLDIYDPDLLPAGKNLKLEPWEYYPGGYFADLTDWLSNNMAKFGFYRPFGQPDNKVATEPWHISYRPLAKVLELQLTPDMIKQLLQQGKIAGSGWLENNLNRLFNDYIVKGGD